MAQPPRTPGEADRDFVAALALAEQIRPALEQRDRRRLIEIVRGLLAMCAPMGEQWRQIAYLAANNGELGLARQAIDRLAEALGGTPAAQYEKATQLSVLGDWDEADGLLRGLPETVPDPLGNAYSRGIVALNLGQAEEARRRLEQVVRMRPQTGTAWLALSMLADFADEPQLADRVVAAERKMADARPAEQVPFLYALGKVHAERGDPARAFEAYARGARLMKAAVVYDREADSAGAADAVEGYSADRIAAIAGRQSEPTGRTIFVTGLPRSGTTLVAQILASHSAVSGAAEINRLALLEGDVGGPSHAALERYVETHGASSVPPLWHHWLDELFGPARRVVDKTVQSSRFLGLAAALLPDAPLIWLTRDPLDCAWSCFRTNFNGKAMPWSYDLQDIAFHFRLEDRLLSRWQELLGERLLVVPYEALVGGPDGWIRRILAHCGLPEEPQVFAPHETPGVVTTASLMQVRRPINGRAVGSAEPFRDYLQPFIDAYRG